MSAEESTGDRMSQEGGVDLKVDLGAIVTSLASLMTTPVDSNQSRATFISFNQDTTWVLWLVGGHWQQNDSERKLRAKSGWHPRQVGASDTPFNNLTNPRAAVIHPKTLFDNLTKDLITTSPSNLCTYRTFVSPSEHKKITWNATNTDKCSNCIGYQNQAFRVEGFALTCAGLAMIFKKATFVQILIALTCSELLSEK